MQTCLIPSPLSALFSSLGRQIGWSEIGLCLQGLQPGKDWEPLWPPCSQRALLSSLLGVISRRWQLSFYKDPLATVGAAGCAETTAHRKPCANPGRLRRPLPTSRSGKHSKMKYCFSPGKATHRTRPRKPHPQVRTDWEMSRLLGTACPHPLPGRKSQPLPYQCSFRMVQGLWKKLHGDTHAGHGER